VCLWEGGRGGGGVKQMCEEWHQGCKALSMLPGERALYYGVQTFLFSCVRWPVPLPSCALWHLPLPISIWRKLIQL
jgi:hypothetical protein